MNSFSDDLLASIYKLGVMYYEMGYSVPAEKIFLGLHAIGIDESSENNCTPSAIALGVIKLEQQLYNEAVSFFKEFSKDSGYFIDSKIGLSLSFLGMGEFSRAKTIIDEVKDLKNLNKNQRSFVEAIISRCGGLMPTTHQE